MERARPPDLLRLSGREIINLALLLSFPAIALDELLRTPPAQFSAQPVLQVQHWVTDSLMMIPLFAVGIWAGDRIADRAGLIHTKRSVIFKRALLIVLFVAVALMPVWYERNKTDGLVQSQALVTPHSHGSVDVYWVGSGVILALVCVCLVPAAAWAGHAMASRLKRRRLGGPAAIGAASVFVLVAAIGPVLAWLLHNAAEHAYASQVNYTSALLSVPVHSHAFFGGHDSHVAAGLPVTAAPFAFAHQLAHAFQDGLIGQAFGFPLAAAALLWTTRNRTSTSTTAQSSEAQLP